MNNKPLQETIVKALREDIGRGNSQNQVARKMGIAPATLSNMLNGKWNLISEDMLRKVKSYYRLDDTWQIRRTQNLNAIVELCRDAQENHRMLGIAGYTGAGKTTALRHYAGNNMNVFYTHAHFHFQKKDLLRSIQQCMGLNEGGSVNDHIQAIVQKLNTVNNPLLIIDDAGKLNDANFRIIQVIYDATEFNAGIILGGTEYLKEYIDKMASKNKMGFRELRRRIAYWQPLFSPSPDVVARICQDFGIEDKNAIEFVISRGVDYGTIRNIITNARRKAEQGEGKINRELLASLNIGEDDYQAIAS